MQAELVDVVAPDFLADPRGMTVDDLVHPARRTGADPGPIDPPLMVARALAQRFAVTAADLDASGAFPADNVAALFEAGLTNMVTAREYGGGEAGLLESCRVVAEIARGEPSTALILSMHLVNHASIRRGGRWPAAAAEAVVQSGFEGPALVNALQVEPESGSPSYGTLPHTIARKIADGWRLTGRKRFATGCEGLHWLVVSALTDEAEPRLGSFIIARASPGISVIRTWDATGMRATGSHDVVFDDVPVPEGFTLDLAPAELGRRVDPGNMAWFMVLIGSVYSGIARAARDEVLAFASTFKLGMLAAPLATLPLIQDQLGAIEVLVEMNDRLLASVAREADEGVLNGASAGMVRHVVIENAIEVADLALRIAGHAGVSRGHPLERHHRNALCGRTHAPNGFLVRAGAAQAALASAPAVADRREQ